MYLVRLPSDDYYQHEFALVEAPDEDAARNMVFNQIMLWYTMKPFKGKPENKAKNIEKKSKWASKIVKDAEVEQIQFVNNVWFGVAY